jgi:PKD repeat protein
MRIAPLILLSLILLVGVVSADTSIVYTTGVNDGDPTRTSANSTQSNLIGGAGTSYPDTTTDNTAIYSSYLTDTYHVFVKNAIIFDTGNAIPDSATVGSAQYSVYTNAYTINTLGDTPVNVRKFNILGSIDASDYNRFDVTPFSTDKNISSMTGSAYQNFTFNSLGLSNISKTGNTGLSLANGYELYGHIPTWKYFNLGVNRTLYRFYSSDSATNKPYLTIEWTPDTTPPASITNLSNNTALCSEVTFTWDNPTDSDYAYLHVLKNNTWTGNYSNSTSSATWLTLNELTSYTFSSRTVDLDGNMNTTFVNRTVATPICPVTPITSFTSNVTCGNLPLVAVQFNDTSNNNGYAITGYNWSFGDGNTSTLQNPVNSYKVAGAYWVNHSAGNVAGATWSNVSRYMIVVPDWGTCVPTTASAKTIYLSSSTETPLPAIIPVLAILFLILYIRKK